ncbi:MULTISPECIES: TetR/AcrR family transcriptional regulator [unclassified Mesorhizobium]|uniref:TetR/AcrR family transcriptional regulator n=1 Tax=unclassified Mesorhizobium TaxID=325217 RepID=UPI001129A803|nr:MULTISPECIES: TetR/AcrR family transcriptional regulator [unclassified Mesorhizobium]TPJ45518.1 TetR/AcrR family transcriptional regulator [Mesorhizobium sp. B2-6-6]MBZ9704573.1 TetR/AcrR family transcriptional regulator [Mesorhizobium sp. CO1-1-3]MBZ9853029.1 TetR/AcrR family transcriptional regulator [Mesorhizobium sp. CA13]MBZ9869659.1 TetR/AcrR family transcriptional regulator [Mesorhizobium sp. BR1-1-9]MBZ9894786.1 TetR/AcrR family transcriptional regulator [Mesorhizobium sp. BR1-1-6]
MTDGVVERPRPRDRILETARDMFHKHGIKGVGVDAITEAAGTNKMTLYRHFESKDDLIIECLRATASKAGAMWDAFEAEHPGDKLAQLHAWVRKAAEMLTADCRGCDMANAAVELTEPDHPARRVIKELKEAQRERLVALCRGAGIGQAELLADTLSLLCEGARVSVQTVGTEGPSAQLVRMAEGLIQSFRGGAAAG